MKKLLFNNDIELLASRIKRAKSLGYDINLAYAKLGLYISLNAAKCSYNTVYNEIDITEYYEDHEGYTRTKFNLCLDSKVEYTVQLFDRVLEITIL